MTVLENEIRISAPPDKVWSVLASLDALDRYDPGVAKSEIVTPSREGPGAARRCDLTPGGWFKEKIVDAGIKGFFAGLKHYVETGQRPAGKE